MKQKIGKQVIGAPKWGNVKPFEDTMNLQYILKYEMRGVECACYFLEKNEAFKFIFGWTSRGIHASLTQEEMEPLFDALESGLKDIPQNERLTIRQSSFVDCRQRLEELKHLFDQAPTRELKFLMYSEMERVKELSRQGLRKPKRLRIFATYTVEREEDSKELVEGVMYKVAKVCKNIWANFTGTKEIIEEQNFQDLFEKGFVNGYLPWQQLLNTKMNLFINPMTVEELWEEVWYEFNLEKPPQIPQMIRVTDESFEEITNQEKLHITSCLLQEDTSLPVAYRNCVKVKGKYVAPLVLMDKPSGWASKKSQLRWLWEILARDTVKDIEIISQLTPVSSQSVREDLYRLTKQATVAQEVSAEKSDIDVKASIEQEQAIEAQAALIEGAAPINVALVILVYRDTIEELEEACLNISSLFYKPCWVEWEKEYGWLIWQQSLTTTWENLLAKPFDRRLPFLTGEAPGLIPIVSIWSKDKRGFEFISDEGGVPVYLDGFSKVLRMGAFATTRGGKSVLISQWLTHGLVTGHKIIVYDFPKPDGTSTFTDYTKFLQNIAAYFDISKERWNLFERPQLQNFSPEERAIRMQDWSAYILDALMVMVIGKSSGEMSSQERLLRQNIQTILTLALNQFLTDPEISERYNSAEMFGFGTEQWEQYPCLKDFYQFIKSGKLTIEGRDSIETKTALEMIYLRIQSWLDSRVGKAIGNPSSFRTNSTIVVFALRNLSNDEDAAVLGMIGLTACINIAYTCPKSILFMDECPILFEYDDIAAAAGRIAANGGKAGINLILSAQEVTTIVQAKSSSKIINNMDIKAVGRIQSSAIKSFIDVFEYPRELISRNASEKFFPDPTLMYSNWLLDTGVRTNCRFYPSIDQLAVVANNPIEQISRDNFIALAEFLGKDMLYGVHLFAIELTKALKAKRQLKYPQISHISAEDIAIPETKLPIPFTNIHNLIATIQESSQQKLKFSILKKEQENYTLTVALEPQTQLPSTPTPHMIKI